MLKTAIIGASGYTGAELALLLTKHPHFTLTGLYVSANSYDAGKSLSTLHGKLAGIVDELLQPLSDIELLVPSLDVVFLATSHQVSHQMVAKILAAGRSGNGSNNCVIIDLSGAYRVPKSEVYPDHYGFVHQYIQGLDQAVYGLAEWLPEQVKTTQLIAVAGCYPTAIQLALKPLVELKLLDPVHMPIINAISGVSGAGRHVSLTNSFCEVSLQPYGVFTHRHQPEISHHLGQAVIFTPHLGNFKRGILATITVKLMPNTTPQQIENAFMRAYKNAPAVRLVKQWPTIQQVEFTPFCDLHWQQQGDYLIIVSAIDNLIKGAAGQAVQCANIRFGFTEMTGLV